MSDPLLQFVAPVPTEFKVVLEPVLEHVVIQIVPGVDLLQLGQERQNAGSVGGHLLFVLVLPLCSGGCWVGCNKRFGGINDVQDRLHPVPLQFQCVP